MITSNYSVEAWRTCYVVAWLFHLELKSFFLTVVAVSPSIRVSGTVVVRCYRFIPQLSIFRFNLMVSLLWTETMDWWMRVPVRPYFAFILNEIIIFASRHGLARPLSPSFHSTAFSSSVFVTSMVASSISFCFSETPSASLRLLKQYSGSCFGQVLLNRRLFSLAQLKSSRRRLDRVFEGASTI